MNSKSILVCIGLTVTVVFVSVSLLPNLADLASNSQGSQSLRLATNIWSGYEPLYLARSLGYFDEDSVRLVECSSASQVIRAFRNNTIEVAALTLDEVLLLKESGYDVRVILVTDISHGGDVILGNSEMNQLTDLRGHNVGVENMALGAYVLTRALQSVGMSVADVNVVALEVDEQEQAFADRKIDAVVTFEPFRSRLMKKGAVQLFDSKQMPEEIVDVLAVRGNTMDAQSENLSILLRGWFSALQYLQEHPEDASQRMVERLRLEPADILASFESLHFPDREENAALLSGKLVKSAQRMCKVMVEQRLLQNEIDVSHMFWAQPLKRIHDN